MELIFGIILGLVILVLLVVVHELGHGIVARRNGVVVEEFGIGFPPKAWGKKIKRSILGKNVLFTLNWLPLGGFVKLQGEHDSASKKGDYGAATYWQKTKILLAGVLMNWVVAIILLSCMALVGLPKILPDQYYVSQDATITTLPLQLTYVGEGTPAEASGLKPGDELLRFNGMGVSSPDDLTKLTQVHKGEAAEIIYKRGGVEYTTKTTLRADNIDKKGFLGVSSRTREEIKSTWSAPIVGTVTTAQFTWATLKGTSEVAFNAAKGFFQSLSFDKATRESGNKELEVVSGSVAGPVGILGVIFPQAQSAGPKQLLFLTAIISLSLAVMNTLPIPALDGGRWFLMTVYKLRKKELTKEREEKVQTIGFLVLIGLVILVTFADVGKFF
ncbi:MAG TPA: M50 family metallopeptidase [Candidatus Saccharimonadales bacterium]